MFGSINPLVSQGVRSEVDEAARVCEVDTVCTKGQAQQHLGAAPGAAPGTAPEAATRAAGDDLDVKVKIVGNGESDTIFARV